MHCLISDRLFVIQQLICLSCVFLGWIGLVLIVYFCINAGYGGTRLGACWAILEERYQEYRSPVRNPYATIAYRAVGKWGRYNSSVLYNCYYWTLWLHYFFCFVL